MKKRLMRALILALALVMVLSMAACGDSDDSSSGGSSSNYSYNYVSPYVSMVKNARHSTYGITYGAAFDSFFSNPKWEYFEATDGSDVVEFTGGFSYYDQPAKAKIQFVVDYVGGTFRAHHLSIDGEAQSQMMLAAMIQKVFESY